MSLPATLLLLALQAQSAAPSPTADPLPAEYVDAKRVADANEAGVTGNAHAAMVAAQGAALQAGIAECVRLQVPNDFSPFTVVMALDASGAVTRTWRQGTSPLAICLQRQLRGQVIWTPPRAPFLMSMELSFTK